MHAFSYNIQTPLQFIRKAYSISYLVTEHLGLAHISNSYTAVDLPDNDPHWYLCRQT